MTTVWTLGKVISLIILIIGVLAASFLVQNNKTVSGEIYRANAGNNDS